MSFSLNMFNYPEDTLSVSFFDSLEKVSSKINLGRINDDEGDEEFEELFKVPKAKESNQAEDTTENETSFFKDKIFHIIKIPKEKKAMKVEDGCDTLLQKKRGRKKKGESEGAYGNGLMHSKFSFDNILKRLKVMFCSYCLQVINTSIQKSNKGCQKYKFRKINSKKTKNISTKFNRGVVLSPIKNFILDDVSIKFKEDKKDLNRINYEKVASLNKKKIGKYDDIIKFLDMKYKDIYEGMFINEFNRYTSYFSPEFNQVVNECQNLNKCLQKIQLKEGASDLYLHQLKKVAKEQFLNYFIYGKKTTKARNHDL